MAHRRRLHNTKRDSDFLNLKLRVQQRKYKKHIAKLESRIDDLLGMNMELEEMLSVYEKQESDYNNPWTARLETVNMNKKISENYNDF